jgi:hypothetical protein
MLSREAASPGAGKRRPLRSGEAVRGIPGPGQPRGRLDQQGVAERLRPVASQLPLPDVVFLGGQAGWLRQISESSS